MQKAYFVALIPIGVNGDVAPCLGTHTNLDSFFMPILWHQICTWPRHTSLRTLTFVLICLFTCWNVSNFFLGGFMKSDLSHILVEITLVVKRNKSSTFQTLQILHIRACICILTWQQDATFPLIWVLLTWTILARHGSKWRHGKERYIYWNCQHVEDANPLGKN